MYKELYHDNLYRSKSSPAQVNTVFLILILAVAFILPLMWQANLVSIGTINMIGRYLAFAIVAVGLDMIWGYTGILSLCQAFFFALGGYAMGMYLTLQGDLTNGIPYSLYVVYPYKVGEAKGMEVLPFYWLPCKLLFTTIIFGLFFPALIAGIIGFFGFISRVRGVYFSILTQALTVAAWMFFSKNEMKLCGTNGLTNFSTIAGFNLHDDNTKIWLYYATLISLVSVYLICFFITKSRFGRVLIAVRDSEKTLRFAGYKPYLFKTAIFAFSGFLAGLAGLLYTPQASIITPSYMEARWSILMVVWVAVGGRGTLSGAVVGALLVNLLYNFLTSQWQLGQIIWKPEYWPFVLGTLFIFVVLLFPGGIISLWKKLIGTFTKDYV